MAAGTLSFYLRGQRNPRDTRQNLPVHCLSTSFLILVRLRLRLSLAGIRDQRDLPLEKMSTIPRWSATPDNVDVARILTAPGSDLSTRQGG